MKILFCTSTFEHIGHGPAKFANLLLHISKKFPDYEVKILTEDVKAENIALYEDQVIKAEFQLNRLQRLIGLIYRMIPYYHEAVRVKQFFDYDVLVFNNAIIGIYSAFKLSIPVVGMINDDNNLMKSLLNIELKKRWLRGIIFKFFEQLACRIESHIIVNSDFLLKKVRETYKIADSKISRLYKSVDSSGISFENKASLGNPITILFVKSNFYTGGLYDLIDALLTLTEYNFCVNIVGPDLSRAKDIQKHYAGQGGKNVILNFPGRLDQNGVYRYMKKADVFSVPAKQEALGVANMEAIMHGVPVVTTFAGGIPEVLGKGKFGWLASPSDKADLAKKMKECIESPGLRLQKSFEGNRFVRTNFDKDVMLENFINILKSTTGR